MLIIAALGCADDQPRVEKNEMKSNNVPEEAADESGVALFHLTSGIPDDEIPAFLKEREKTDDARITLDDVRALPPAEKAQMLTVIEQAVEYYREKSGRHRGLANPDERTAKRLEAFLMEARNASDADRNAGN